MSSFLHIIDTTGPGGAETVFLDLASETKRHGHSCFAIIRGPGWVEDQLKKRGISYRIVDSKGSFNFRFVWVLVKEIRKHRVNIIQSHLFGSSIYAALASLITGVRLVSTVHGMVDISDRERFLKLKVWVLNKGVARLIAVTDQISAKLANYKGIDSSKLSTVYNGIDVDRYASVALSSAPSSECQETRVGCLGNIREPKNYGLALDTVAEIKKKGISVELCIAGQGSDAQQAPLRTKIKELGIEGNVKLLGFVSDTPAFLSSLDVFLMTSSSEGHPLALTQAMANGLPIVSTPSGVQEIVDNGEQALISKKHDAKELAELVLRIIGDEVLANDLGAKAQAKARAQYSEQAMFESYFLMYRELSKECA